MSFGRSLAGRAAGKALETGGCWRGGTESQQWCESFRSSLERCIRGWTTRMESREIRRDDETTATAFRDTTTITFASCSIGDVSLGDSVDILRGAAQDDCCHLSEFGEVESKVSSLIATLTREANSDEVSEAREAREARAVEHLELLRELPDAAERANLAAAQFREAVTQLQRRCNEKKALERRRVEVEQSLQQLLTWAEDTSGDETVYQELQQRISEVSELPTETQRSLETLKTRGEAVLQEKRSMDETAQQVQQKLRAATLAESCEPEMLEAALQDAESFIKTCFNVSWCFIKTLLKVLYRFISFYWTFTKFGSEEHFVSSSLLAARCEVSQWKGMIMLIYVYIYIYVASQSSQSSLAVGRMLRWSNEAVLCTVLHFPHSYSLLHASLVPQRWRWITVRRCSKYINLL